MVDEEGGRANILITDEQFEAVVKEIARHYLPEPGSHMLRPQLFSVAADRPAIDSEEQAVEIFDLDTVLGHGESQTANYVYTVGRMVARSHRYAIAAFIQLERPLRSPLAQWPAIEQPGQWPEQRQAQLVGLTIDGRVAGCSVLLERDNRGNIVYCSEHADLDRNAKGAICDDAIGYLSEFWHGFMEVIVDQLHKAP